MARPVSASLRGQCLYRVFTRERNQSFFWEIDICTTEHASNDTSPRRPRPVPLASRYVLIGGQGSTRFEERRDQHAVALEKASVRPLSLFGAAAR